MRSVVGFVVAVVGVVAVLSGASAALPTASELFFEKPYLSLLAPGTRVAYTYKHVTTDEKLGPSFDEKLQLNVEAAPDDPAKRVADIDIWRGDLHNEAGPFPTASGNPVSLVLLERDVKEIAALSKGSPFYIRNRVRDALATATVEETRFDHDGRNLAGWKMTMTPFASDPNRDKLAEIAGRRYEFVFSDAVPGGLYAINVATPAADGKSNMIETTVTLAGSTAPAAAK